MVRQPLLSLKSASLCRFRSNGKLLEKPARGAHLLRLAIDEVKSLLKCPTLTGPVQYYSDSDRTAILNVEIVRSKEVGIDVNNKLFVGNLSFKTTQQELQDLFAEHGEVISVAIPQDRETGRQRGFAFVEMSNQAQAEAAIKALNGREVDGRQIAVNVSTPKPRDGGGGRGRY
jgi:hypothetical protein